jgi:hydroxypyruvate reductase
MATSRRSLRSDARLIWRRGQQAADPLPLMRRALRLERRSLRIGDTRIPLNDIDSITVIGGGKAGARMAMAVELILGRRLLSAGKVQGWVNVPDSAVGPLKAIRLWGARARPDNQPTRRGVLGTRRIQSILDSLGERDLALCVLSGGLRLLADPAQRHPGGWRRIAGCCSPRVPIGESTPCEHAASQGRRMGTRFAGSAWCR